jgi:hypothetical protein
MLIGVSGSDADAFWASSVSVPSLLSRRRRKMSFRSNCCGPDNPPRTRNRIGCNGVGLDDGRGLVRQLRCLHISSAWINPG